MIYDKNDFVLNIIKFSFLKCFISRAEKLRRLMNYKLVSDVIFVLEVKVESTLCNTGLLDDIRYGSLLKSLCHKEIK